MFLKLMCYLFLFSFLILSAEGKSREKINKTQRKLPFLGPEERNKLMPSLYFIGVSKCGTSTMARLLTEHPLVTGVGNQTDPWGESRILQIPYWNAKRIATLQTDRVAQNLRSVSSDDLRTENIRRGVIMHYTPNYAMSKVAMQNLQATVPFFDPDEKLENKKFLIMLRNPNTRATSSWWVKEKLKTQSRISSQSAFGPLLRAGIAKELELRECYATQGFNFSDMITRNLDLQALQDTQVLQKCSLATLNGIGTEKRAHIGKSLYAHTLVHWMAIVPLENIYFMTMEGFSRDPAHEVEMFFQWLNIPVYGEYGFKSASDIYERAKSLHIHNHPIHKDIFETEITPALPLMNSFFKRSIIDLQNILGNFILQKIQASKISQELSVEAKSRMDDMKDAFTRLEALATNRTGDWEDVVDLLSTLHTIVF